MKKLQELKTGECLYTILAYYDKSNGYEKIMISSRKVTKVETSNHSIRVHMEKVTKCPLFGTVVKFGKDKQECEYVINSERVFDCYCFSGEALLMQVKQMLKNIKPSIKSYNRQDTIRQYYDEFMPTVIKMIYSNETEYTVLNNR